MTLHPLKFEEIVKGVLAVKPPPKPPKRKPRSKAR
jgi:hypothetical protein